MKIDSRVSALVLSGEDGTTLRVFHDNRAEPYREGIAISLEIDEYYNSNRVFLEMREAILLRDKLNELIPV